LARPQKSLPIPVLYKPIPNFKTYAVETESLNSQNQCCYTVQGDRHPAKETKWQMEEEHSFILMELKMLVPNNITYG
jgi:hypothetical protein